MKRVLAFFANAIVAVAVLQLIPHPAWGACSGASSRAPLLCKDDNKLMLSQLPGTVLAGAGIALGTSTNTSTATATGTGTGTASATATGTGTGTRTDVASATITLTATGTATRTLNTTHVHTITYTSTSTTTKTHSVTGTSSYSIADTITVTYTGTQTQTGTATQTKLVTAAETVTAFGTVTGTGGGTRTAAGTATASATAVGSGTGTWTSAAYSGTFTETATASGTGSRTMTAAATGTGSGTFTRTSATVSTITITGTLLYPIPYNATYTTTATGTGTVSGTVTLTATVTNTNTNTNTATATSCLLSTPRGCGIINTIGEGVLAGSGSAGYVALWTGASSLGIMPLQYDGDTMSSLVSDLTVYGDALAAQVTANTALISNGPISGTTGGPVVKNIAGYAIGSYSAQNGTWVAIADVPYTAANRAASNSLLATATVSLATQSGMACLAKISIDGTDGPISRGTAAGAGTVYANLSVTTLGQSVTAYPDHHHVILYITSNGLTDCTSTTDYGGLVIYEQ